MILTKKLTIKQQQQILYTLFGFVLDDNNEDGKFVLYDEEGGEFYSPYENNEFDFTTLEGVFKYATHAAREKGYSEAQFDIRKVLGIRT